MISEINCWKFSDIFCLLVYVYCMGAYKINTGVYKVPYPPGGWNQTMWNVGREIKKWEGKRGGEGKGKWKRKEKGNEKKREVKKKRKKGKSKKKKKRKEKGEGKFSFNSLPLPPPFPFSYGYIIKIKDFLWTALEEYLLINFLHENEYQRYFIKSSFHMIFL